MVARPLVQGAEVGRTAVAAAAHTVTMLVGAALTATLLTVLARSAGPLPDGAVAAVCLAAAAVLVAQSRLPLRVPGSAWMVPREWARFGATGHAALFGLALGTGVMTVLPSPALYGVVAAAESSPWPLTYIIVLTFAAGRALMVPLLTARSARRGVHPAVGIDRVRDTMAQLGAVEFVLLTALAVELLRA